MTQDQHEGACSKSRYNLHMCMIRSEDVPTPMLSSLSRFVKRVFVTGNLRESIINRLGDVVDDAGGVVCCWA